LPLSYDVHLITSKSDTSIAHFDVHDKFCFRRCWRMDFVLLLLRDLLPVDGLAIDVVGRFHQDLAQRGMGVHTVGDLFSGQLGVVGQHQLG